MFWTRLFSGIILVILAAVSIAAGSAVLFTVLLAVSIIGMNELYRATGVHQKDFGPLEIAGYAWDIILLFYGARVRRFLW